MQSLLAIAMAALVMAVAVSPGFAAACPTDPVKCELPDSKGAGVLRFNQAETGTHPCGRKYYRTGGNTPKRIPRTCNWE